MVGLGMRLFGPGVHPIAMVCTSIKSVEEFKMHDHALQDTYEVHGGSHSYAVRLELLAIP